MRSSKQIALLAVLCGVAPFPAHSDETTGARAAEPSPNGVWKYDPGAGAVYQDGDFRWVLWGYAERLIDGYGGNDKWRRFRQGSEFDLPRITDSLRPALVYEIDMVDSDFFNNGFGGRKGFGRRNLENLFAAVQDASDPRRLRVLFGENPHILSREDNLSSGNLPTINRSLILEELGTINTFGTQFGVQYLTALSPEYSVAFAALDNRGSFNVDQPQYSVGNSLAGKLLATPINDRNSGEKLTWGVGIDNTMDIHNGKLRVVSPLMV